MFKLSDNVHAITSLRCCCYNFQAIRVLRTGDFSPLIVFVAAPTIATLHEVNGALHQVVSRCLPLHMFLVTAKYSSWKY